MMHRLRSAILALSGFVLLALTILCLLFLRQQHSAALERAETSTWQLAQVLEQYARRTFGISALVTAQVASAIQAAGGVDGMRGNREFHLWLQALQDRIDGDSIMVLDAAGRLVAMSQQFPVPDTDFSDRRCFQVVRGGQEVLVGEAMTGRVSEDLIFTLTRALHKPEGGFDGVALVAHRPAYFQQMLSEAGHGGGISIAMFDGEGRVLTRTGLTEAMIGESIAGAPPLTLPDPVGTFRGVLPIDGANRIVSYRRLADWPVVVIASMTFTDALAPFRNALAWSAAVAAAVVAGLVLLTGLALRIAGAEARARGALAAANTQLRDAASDLEARVAERTSSLARTGEELAASEARFRAIFDTSFQYIAVLQPDGTLLDLNATAMRFVDQTIEERRGRPIWDAPVWQGAVGERLRLAIAAAAAGRPQRYEEVVQGRLGRASISLSIKPIRDAQGQVVLLVQESHDMTDLKATEARLREAQKMESLGQLTGGVAHDFNNLLMAVLGNLALLRKRLPPDDARALRMLDGAHQGAQRGAALTQRLLAFARRQELRPEPVDLASLLGGLRGLLERSAGPGVGLSFEVPAGMPPALADANQLELAVLNLVLNARDSLAEQPRDAQEQTIPTILIQLSQGLAPESGEAGDAIPTGLRPGGYLRIGVRDAGAGMDAATLARATEPFFTTKGAGRGSGLGLSMVQGLAQQSGGGLLLISQKGHGTLAEIWLPQAEAPAPPAPPIAAAPAMTLPPRRILLVDDDPLVLAGTAMMLEELGHGVLQAASAAEALDLLGTSPSVDVVLTDYAMPGMNGAQLAERLRQRFPRLPVGIVSGYAELSAEITPWLPRLNKPCRQEDLAALLAKLEPRVLTAPDPA